MKYVLPDNHGLPPILISSPYVTGEDGVRVTDIQYAALEEGVAQGRSLIASAPTSSGKTGIGVFAMASWLAGRQPGRARTVYLASHKALAKEKFLEFQSGLLPLLGLEPNHIVLATGDGVEDGAGNTFVEPLAAPIVVATYEKYLGTLGASGLPENMEDVCVVCDELQIIGEESRGQEVEILLTLLRRAQCGQIVGLSAVLDAVDARDIATWINGRLVRSETREVELTYELRLPNAKYEVSTSTPDEIVETAGPNVTSTIATIHNLIQSGNAGPIAVFCTKRADVFKLAQEWDRLATPVAGFQQSFTFDEETSSSRELTGFLPKAFAFHTADLTSEEREAVELSLRNDVLQVVFATTTLAFGLNFSFKTVIIHEWARWNFAAKVLEPIPVAEFHNMAGRAGRLSKAEGGRAIFFSEASRAAHARPFLRLGHVDRLKSRINPERFDHLVLNLIGAGIATNERTLALFLGDTLSAARERDRNARLDEAWARALKDCLTRLQGWGFINGQLRLTDIGRRVSTSGLQPAAAHYLVEYLGRNIENLTKLEAAPERDDANSKVTEDLEFALSFACLTSPDFDYKLGGRRRFPFQIDGRRASDRGTRLTQVLAVQPWHERAPQANAADLACEWIQGVPLQDLEDYFMDLRSGVLRGVFDDVAQMLNGWAEIAMAATAPSLPAHEHLSYLPELTPESRDKIRILAAAMRNTARRLCEGLPDDAMWMTQLEEEGRRLLRRSEVTSLHAQTIRSPSDLLDPGRTNILVQALRAVVGNVHNVVDRIRKALGNRRVKETKRLRESQIKRAGEAWRDLIDRLYDSQGVPFENALGEAFERLGVNVVERDGQDRQKQSFPDFVVNLPGVGYVCIECKTCEPHNSIDLTNATDVMRKAGIHGLHDAYKVTVCKPYLATDVPRKITNSHRLAVINAEDFIEALVRIAAGRITLEALADWVAQPGQLMADSLISKRAETNIAVPAHQEA